MNLKKRASECEGKKVIEENIKAWIAPSKQNLWVKLKPNSTLHGCTRMKVQLFMMKKVWMGSGNEGKLNELFNCEEKQRNLWERTKLMIF